MNAIPKKHFVIQDASRVLAERSVTDRNDLQFTPTMFVDTFLPVNRPQGTEWQSKNKLVRLICSQDGYGIPFGCPGRAVIGRLIKGCQLNKDNPNVANKRVVRIGNSIREAQDLMVGEFISSSSGKKGSQETLRRAIYSVADTHIAWRKLSERTAGGVVYRGKQLYNDRFTEYAWLEEGEQKFRIAGKRRPPRIWNDTITVSEWFYDLAINRSLPYDGAALKAFWGDAVLLDQHSWYTLKCHEMLQPGIKHDISNGGGELWMTWKQLQAQFAPEQSINTIRTFRQRFNERHELIQNLYREVGGDILHMHDQGDGRVLFRPVRTSVPPKGVTEEVFRIAAARRRRRYVDDRQRELFV